MDARKIKKDKALLISQWVGQMTEARSVHQVSLIWAKRDEVLKVFPNNQEDFRKFFDVLNLCQFKPTASPEELERVLKEKNALIEKIRRSGDGA